MPFLVLEPERSELPEICDMRISHRISHFRRQPLSVSTAGDFLGANDRCCSKQGNGTMIHLGPDPKACLCVLGKDIGGNAAFSLNILDLLMDFVHPGHT